MIDPNKTITEGELFEAIETVVKDVTDAAGVLGIDVKSEEIRKRFRAVNDVLVELGYSQNAFYRYILERKEQVEDAAGTLQ